MIGVADLQKIVALALCSAYVENDKPLSLLIIGDRPESGKTEVLKGFAGTPKVKFLSDVSGYGLLKYSSDDIRAGRVNHIIIPEFLKPLSKGKATAQSFTSTLGVLMEDGLMGIYTGFLPKQDLEVDRGIRAIGFIGCMPRQTYSRELKRQWVVSGFLSRWLVVSYSYSTKTLEDIFASIARGDYLEDKNQLLALDKRIKVHIPPKIAQKCEELGLRITQEARDAGSLYGFREVKHIRSLVASNVVYEQLTDKNRGSTATVEDFNEVESLGYLFNEQYNEVRK